MYVTSIYMIIRILILSDKAGLAQARLRLLFSCRKWSLLCNNVVILGGVALESFAVNPYMLVAGRFVVGLNAG